MWKILLEEFVGDLRSQKTRAILTTFAVTWGTIAVVLMLAFGEGLRVMVNRGLLAAGDRMFMVYGGETSKDFEGLGKGRRIRLAEEDASLVERSVPDVEMVGISYGRWGVAMQAGAIKTTAYVEGVTPTHAEMRNMLPSRGGRFLDDPDVGLKRRVVFLGDTLAARLFPGEDPVGKQVMMDRLPFTVVGVLEHKFQTSSNNGPDEERAVIPASTMKAIYGMPNVDCILVRPRSIEAAGRVKAGLYQVLGRRYHFAADDEAALRMWDFVEDQKMTGRIGLGIEIFLGVVGALTLLVAGVGVANIMYVVAKERTREIGIKLAIGARKRHIVAQFLFEGVALAMGGGLIGLGIAAAIVMGVNAIPGHGNMSYEFLGNPRLSWPIGFTVVGILTSIGLAAGYFPARRAAAVDPVESLRYE